MKQHFIPQVYLKEFLNKNGKLYTLDTALLKYGRSVFSEERSTAEVCRSKDFYTLNPSLISTFPHMKDLHRLSIEESFQHYERKYPKIIAKIKAKQQAIPIDDARTLMYTLLDFKIRNVHFRENVVPKAYVAAVEEIIGEYKYGIQHDYLPAALNLSREEVLKQLDLIEKKFKGISSPEDMHLSAIAQRKQETEGIQDKIIEHALGLEWIMFESNDGFVTNDNPGVSVDSRNRVQNTKFDEDYRYFCPLTPSLCLSFDASRFDQRYKTNKVQKYISYQKCSAQATAQINQLCGYHVNRHIFAQSKEVIDSIAVSINRAAELKGEIKRTQ